MGFYGLPAIEVCLLQYPPASCIYHAHPVLSLAPCAVPCEDYSLDLTSATLVSGEQKDSSGLRLGDKLAAEWELTDALAAFEGGSSATITVTWKSDESGSRDRGEYQRFILDGEQILEVHNDGCNPDLCSESVTVSQWTVGTLTIEAASTVRSGHTHMTLEGVDLSYCGTALDNCCHAQTYALRTHKNKSQAYYTVLNQTHNNH
jgi:hypothetical protein